MKKHLFIFVLILSVLESFSQNGVHNVDSTTKRVTNWNTRLDFNYVYSYDFDLKEGSQMYRANCIVIIEIDKNGEGRLITAMNGEKNILKLITCYEYDSSYQFKTQNKYNKTIYAVISKRNNYIDKFWIETEDNISPVFSN